MSTEDQEKPDNTDAQSAENTSLARNFRPNQEPPNNQGTHPGKQKYTFLERLLDLLRDPRAWLEIVGLAVLICYTRYAGKQSDTMSNTLVEIRKQTKYSLQAAASATSAAQTAQDTLKTARDNFLLDQRPWIFTNAVLPEPNTAHDPQGHYLVGAYMYWRIYDSNYGRSPALRLRGAAKLFHGRNAMREADTFFRNLPRPWPDTTGGAVLPPGGPPAPHSLVPGGEPEQVGQEFETVRTDKPLTAADVAFLYGHDISIVIVGRFQYRYVSGQNLYWTDFCRSTFISGAINDCGGQHNEVH